MIDAVVMGNVNLRTVGLIMAGNARPTYYFYNGKIFFKNVISVTYMSGKI